MRPFYRATIKWLSSRPSPASARGLQNRRGRGSRVACLAWSSAPHSSGITVNSPGGKNLALIQPLPQRPVRPRPTWLSGYAGQYVYLDAGWAQYVVRKGDVNTFLADNVAAAQSEGLGLVVGLNALKGNVDQSSLTASQIKNFGSVLLGSSYPCAFISWQYDSTYFAQTDIESAMELLSKKPKRHAPTSCRQ